MGHVALYLLLFLTASLGSGEGLESVAKAQLGQCFISFDQSDADIDVSLDDLDETVTASQPLLISRLTSLSLFTSTDCLVSEHVKCHLIRAPPHSLA